MANSSFDKIAFIAEGMILSGLKNMLGGEGFPEHSDATVQLDCLYVYADALVAGTMNRTEHGGLKLLEKILASPEPERCHVVVLGLGSVKSYGHYNYLVEPETGFPYHRLPINILALGLPDQNCLERWAALRHQALRNTFMLSIRQIRDEFAAHDGEKLREDAFWGSANRRIEFALSGNVTISQLLRIEDMAAWPGRLEQKIEENFHTFEAAGIEEDWPLFLNHLRLCIADYRHSINGLTQFPESATTITVPHLSDRLQDVLFCIDGVRKRIVLLVTTLNNWIAERKEGASCPA